MIRRLFKKGDVRERFKCVLIHGGGGLHFNQDHVLTQSVRKRFGEDIYSVELPGHGVTSSERSIDVQEARETIREMIFPLIENRENERILFVGFSIGGKLIQSLWPEICKLQDDANGVFIASPPTQITRWWLIRLFWTTYAFQFRGASSVMEKMHGEGWKQMVQNCRSWLQPGSPMHCNDKAVGALTNDGSSVFWIRGDYDHAFLDDDFVYLPPENVITVHSGHFDFFSRRTGWKHALPAIDSCFAKILSS